MQPGQRIKLLTENQVAGNRPPALLAICRADNGEWVLPGGVVELDEDPRDTVRREVLEEAGVTVEPGQLTGVYKNMRLGVVSLVFRCRPLSGTAHPTEEASKVAWLDRDQITERMATTFAVRLTDALDAGNPLLRGPPAACYSHFTKPLVE